MAPVSIFIDFYEKNAGGPPALRGVIDAPGRMLYIREEEGKKGSPLMRRVFTVVFDKEEDGYTVTVPALPGLVTGGRTFEEARLMALDAIRCHLESLLKDGEEIPEERGVDVEKLEVELSTA
jgi:antitoxin HicB